MNRAIRRISGFMLATLLAFVATAATPIERHAYPTADAAAAALVQALKAHDQNALANVLGSDWKDYIPVSGVAREDIDAFVDLYAHKHRIVKADDKTRIEVGDEGWTLPIPLVQEHDGWVFDLDAGRQEMIARRIEINQWSVVNALLAYYDAQRDYAADKHDGDSVQHYAMRLISSPGKHDGLYWPAGASDSQSPLGMYFAAAPKGQEYLGYSYKILDAQSASAPGGAYSYMTGKRMTDGFALIAWPAHYGDSGSMTYMISHDGLVFQKDLGKDSASKAPSMKQFDPDSSWTEVRTEY